jgi:hypothetical protein
MEDLHWADAATVRMLVRRRRSLDWPLLIVATVGETSIGP